jgi:hypothetical protein
VTRAEVHAVAREILDCSRRTTGVLLPELDGSGLGGSQSAVSAGADADELDVAPLARARAAVAGSPTPPAAALVLSEDLEA